MRTTEWWPCVKTRRRSISDKDGTMSERSCLLIRHQRAKNAGGGPWTASSTFSGRIADRRQSTGTHGRRFEARRSKRASSQSLTGGRGCASPDQHGLRQLQGQRRLVPRAAALAGDRHHAQAGASALRCLGSCRLTAPAGQAEGEVSIRRVKPKQWLRVVKLRNHIKIVSQPLPPGYGTKFASSCCWEREKAESRQCSSKCT
jgi:hypothetical protein